MKLKPFWGINITHDKKNEKIEGDCFIIDRATLAQTAAIDNAAENALEVATAAKLPTFLNVMLYLCKFSGLVFAFGILKGFSKKGVTLAQAYSNAPWAFWCAGACLVLWGVLEIFAKKKRQQVAESPECEAAQDEIEIAAEEIYEKFNVPKDTPYVDILTFHYKIKNGEAVTKTRSSDITTHINIATRMFVEGENLIIADREAKYAFPLSSLRKIHTVKKRISIPFWTKDVEHNEGEYKQYKIAVNQFGCLLFKPYYILEIDCKGVGWGITFPCYELPIVEAITGLKAE
jgi:hypothetical protein